MIWIMYSRHATVGNGCIINRSVDILISHMQKLWTFIRVMLTFWSQASMNSKSESCQQKPFSHIEQILILSTGSQ